MRHWRRGEPLDEACRLARNARNTERYHGVRDAMEAYRSIQQSARARALADLVRRHQAEYELSYRRYLVAEMQKCRTEKEGSGDE